MGLRDRRACARRARAAGAAEETSRARRLRARRPVERERAGPGLLERQRAGGLEQQGPGQQAEVGFVTDEDDRPLGRLGLGSEPRSRARAEPPEPSAATGARRARRRAPRRGAPPCGRRGRRGSSRCVAVAGSEPGQAPRGGARLLLAARRERPGAIVGPARGIRAVPRDRGGRG